MAGDQERKQLLNDLLARRTSVDLNLAELAPEIASPASVKALLDDHQSVANELAADLTTIWQRLRLRTDNSVRITTNETTHQGNTFLWENLQTCLGRGGKGFRFLRCESWRPSNTVQYGEPQIVYPGRLGRLVGKKPYTITPTTTTPTKSGDNRLQTVEIMEMDTDDVVSKDESYPPKIDADPQQWLEKYYADRQIYRKPWEDARFRWGMILNPRGEVLSIGMHVYIGVLKHFQKMLPEGIILATHQDVSIDMIGGGVTVSNEWYPDRQKTPTAPDKQHSTYSFRLHSDGCLRCADPRLTTTFKDVFAEAFVTYPLALKAAPKEPKVAKETQSPQ